MRGINLVIDRIGEPAPKLFAMVGMEGNGRMK